jgi:hemolysin III
LEKRIQSPEEEIANCISHGIGLILAIIAAPVLIISVVDRGSYADLVGACVFSASMILLYFSSTIYHALPRNRAKQIFKILDHWSIYLLIAGTYTPFTLGILRGTVGWILFTAIWSLAIAGIILKSICGAGTYPKTSVALYLVMGWLALIVLKPMWQLIPGWGMFWILSGGIAYTTGVIFFALDRSRYCHLIWHIFVLAGTACHFFAVLWYATPIN